MQQNRQSRHRRGKNQKNKERSGGRLDDGSMIALPDSTNTGRNTLPFTYHIVRYSATVHSTVYPRDIFSTSRHEIDRLHSHLPCNIMASPFSRHEWNAKNALYCLGVNRPSWPSTTTQYVSRTEREKEGKTPRNTPSLKKWPTHRSIYPVHVFVYPSWFSRSLRHGHKVLLIIARPYGMYEAVYHTAAHIWQTSTSRTMIT